MKFIITGLVPYWLYWKLYYYEWALQHMHPLHADYPEVMLKLAALRQRLKEGEGK